MSEGLSRNHQGQGTANRRFLFHNAYLELLWVHNQEEAKSEAIYRTRLWERWRDPQNPPQPPLSKGGQGGGSADRYNGACPFGFCLRSTDSEDSLPFSSWAYRPPWLPKTMKIAIGNNSDILTEPMLFHIMPSQRPDSYPAEKLQPIDHGVGLREITRVELVSPAANHISPELQAVIDTNQLTLQEGSEYCIYLGFDGEQQGKQADFRPEVPLMIRW